MAVVKYFDWDKKKNQKLKLERGIGFEDIIVAIDEDRLLVTLKHHKRSNQKIYVVNVGEYAYMIPFVEDDEKKFLKTIYPSRKMTKKYLIERRKK
jgi:uncharacterized DUF497 family protein